MKSRLFYQPYKYAEILKLAVPLILSNSGLVLMQFIDGVFLSRYSATSIAASGSAGCISWMVGSIVFGTVGYTNVLVSNYVGAKKDGRVGPAVWQGMHLSILGGILTFLLSFASTWLFRSFGHEESLAQEEGIYLQILLAGSIFHFAKCAIGGFFSGRGDNVRLMCAEIIGQLVNVIGDYVLIFGKFGFPEWGIAGAAVATVGSGLVPFLILLFLSLQRRHRIQFHTWRGRGIDLSLLKDLFVYGFPSGLQMFVDAGLWSVFLIIVGHIGTIELAATTIVFRLNSIALQPVLGLGRAEGTKVGQAHGAKDDRAALEYMMHGVVLSQLWMTLIAITYILFPRSYVSPFLEEGQENAELLMHTTVCLLRFVALYCLCDCMNVSMMAGLNAVGDTKYSFKVMCWMTCILALFLIVANYFQAGFYFIWTLVTIYVMVLPPFWIQRIRSGVWKKFTLAK